MRGDRGGHQCAQVVCEDIEARRRRSLNDRHAGLRAVASWTDGARVSAAEQELEQAQLCLCRSARQRATVELPHSLSPRHAEHTLGLLLGEVDELFVTVGVLLWGHVDDAHGAVLAHIVRFLKRVYPGYRRIATPGLNLPFRERPVALGPAGEAAEPGGRVGHCVPRSYARFLTGLDVESELLGLRIRLLDELLGGEVRGGGCASLRLAAIRAEQPSRHVRGANRAVPDAFDQAQHTGLGGVSAAGSLELASKVRGLDRLGCGRLGTGIMVD